MERFSQAKLNPRKQCIVVKQNLNFKNLFTGAEIIKASVRNNFNYLNPESIKLSFKCQNVKKVKKMFFFLILKTK